MERWLLLPSITAFGFLTYRGFELLFRTARAQQRYQQRTMSTQILSLKMISKSRYPTYLRVKGVWTWMLALLMALLITFQIQAVIIN